MSLFVMSTDTPSSLRGLSPAWRPWSRRSSRTPQPEVSDSQGGGLLVPKPTHRSTDSTDSRSVRSNASRGRKSFREIVNRLRSSSNVSLPAEPRDLQEKDFKQIEGWIQGFDKYNQLVTNQVSRVQDPSYPQEEFARISKTLTKQCGGGFIHGLPEAMFDLALLWCPQEQMDREDHPAIEPSWSWTGWTGGVNFPFDPTNCPDIRKIQGDFFRSEIVNFNIGPKLKPYTIRREKKERLRIQYPPYFHAPFGSDHTTDSNTLRFQAFTIPADGFDLEGLHDEDQKLLPYTELYDDNMKQCGVVMDYKHLLAKECKVQGAFEFVLLSRNRRCAPATGTRRPAVNTVHPPNTPVWDGERFLWDQELQDLDPKTYEDGEWKMLNVMLIQWLGDYAERVAVGRIHEDAWKARNPVRKDIVLM